MCTRRTEPVMEKGQGKVMPMGRPFSFLFVLMGLFAVSGCHRGFVGRADREKMEQVDSLNSRAYALRYIDTDSSLSCAQQAFRLAESHSDGRCEALNHQMACYLLKMDYDEVARLYAVVQQSTNNQIELLASDVTMMMFCRQTAQNRPFYDYYTRALRRMRRIHEEKGDIPERDQERLFYAETEFRIAAATYYIYMLQEQQAAHELAQIDEEGDIRRDKALLARFYYVKGLSVLWGTEYHPEQTLEAFDNILHAYSLAGRNGPMDYVSAMAAQSLAGLLTDSCNYRTIEENRKSGLVFLRSSLAREDTASAISERFRLPMALAERGWGDAVRSGNLLMMANAYYVKGNISFARKDYPGALSDYEMALSCINDHHRTYYPQDKGRLLTVGRTSDSVSVDMVWATDGNVQTVPAWLAQLRERLSATYSAMDDKQESDYQRNIYLDLLDFARQDKSLESRIEHVEQENRILNAILVAVIFLTLVLALSVLWYARMWHKRNLLRFNVLGEVFNRLGMVSGKDVEELHPMLAANNWMKPESKLLHEVLQPYRNWVDKKRTMSDEMDEEREQLRIGLAESERRIAEDKRENISRRAKVSLVYSITPFIDRILHDVRKMEQAGHMNESTLEYIGELADKINAYNDVLTEWITMNRGRLDLSVESFPLQDIFGLLLKSDYAFRKKGLAFQVHPTTAWVKADKALTFFMINTLADNARKFTPMGGHVEVEAFELSDAIEVSVSDTGCGLSSEDIELILSSKIYDAGRIGGSDASVGKEKGSGFGLLNCKGIIEKYRKSGDLFNVCRFDIESEQGKGSRFSFRLPKGTARLCMVGMWLCLSCHSVTAMSAEQESRDSFLRTAVGYADSVYFANIDGQYEEAMQFADSTFKYINRTYGNSLPEECTQKELARTGFLPGEQEWWDLGVEADYQLIMALRNEVAVAALALHQWEVYEYNNTQYTHLYKLLSQDASLEDFYTRQRDIRMNLSVGIVSLIVVLIVFLVLMFVIYFRRRLLFRFNMMQVLEGYRSMLHMIMGQDQDDTGTLVGKLLDVILSELKELHETEGVRMLFHNEVSAEEKCFSGGAVTYEELTDSMLRNCYEKTRELHDSFINTRFYPLKVNAEDGRELCMGAIAVNYGNYRSQKEDVILERYVIGYLSILLYEGVICRHRDEEDIELAESEMQRAVFEENRLRVQNQILDNCLSTIKHESMYYPNRIKQLVRSIGLDATQDGRAEKLRALTELAGYYKDIYTLLCAQADRQLATGFFRCEAVEAGSLGEDWMKRTIRMTGRRQLSVTPQLECRLGAEKIYADKVLTDYMLETLTDDWTGKLGELNKETELCLTVTGEGGFVKFALSTPESIFSAEQSAGLFYPDTGHYPYLLCKEIIREHDKLNNFCGCRINAEAVRSGGCRIWFTLPIIR